MAHRSPSAALQAAPARRPVGAAAGQPLREQLRRRGPAPERHRGQPGRPGLGRGAGLRPQRARPRAADRRQLHDPARGLFRRPRRLRRAGRRRWPGARARLRLGRPLAGRVHRHGQGAGGRLGLGAADLVGAAGQADEPVGGRPLPIPWPTACRCSRSTCTSTPTPSISAPRRAPTSTPSCATSTGSASRRAMAGRWTPPCRGLPGRTRTSPRSPPPSSAPCWTRGEDVTLVDVCLAEDLSRRTDMLPGARFLRARGHRRLGGRPAPGQAGRRLLRLRLPGQRRADGRAAPARPGRPRARGRHRRLARHGRPDRAAHRRTEARRRVMTKWVTRERPKIDRIACPWLIRRFVEPDAEFLYVPTERVFAVAEETGATPYDIPGAEPFSHDGELCTLRRLHQALRPERSGAAPAGAHRARRRHGPARPGAGGVGPARHLHGAVGQHPRRPRHAGAGHGHLRRALHAGAATPGARSTTGHRPRTARGPRRRRCLERAFRQRARRAAAGTAASAAPARRLLRRGAPGLAAGRPPLLRRPRRADRASCTGSSSTRSAGSARRASCTRSTTAPCCPGPEAQQLAIYIGWLMHRMRGGIVAGTLFVLPGVIGDHGALATSTRLGPGAAHRRAVLRPEGAVLAIVVEACCASARRALKNRACWCSRPPHSSPSSSSACRFPLVVLAAGLVGYLGAGSRFPAAAATAEAKGERSPQPPRCRAGGRPRAPGTARGGRPAGRVRRAGALAGSRSRSS